MRTRRRLELRDELLRLREDGVRVRIVEHPFQRVELFGYHRRRHREPTEAAPVGMSSSSANFFDGHSTASTANCERRSAPPAADHVAHAASSSR